MSSTERQNNLILNQDWSRIYQTFKNADFKSYDFENIRRVIITYLRENYPEDFNDYLESSEYLALIDAIAFLGQSLSFRIDLASRENFIELAERKENVLRIAKMLGYKSKRNRPATGLLKFNSISTTENITDSNGINLALRNVVWNDPTNPNWPEQFTVILNSAMIANTEFGNSIGTTSVDGIPTEQYRFNNISNDVPIFSFEKTVSGRNMTFEVLSTSILNSEDIYEEAPVPGNQLGFIYRQDGQGPGSNNTGFYFLFKQGSLELAEFDINVPNTNETVTVANSNINNSDVWLYQLDRNGNQNNEWTTVTALTGNNIAYNSLVGNNRNVYAIETLENDRIRLQFADGVYGNLPQGSFRVYYRISNGLRYKISPREMKGISLSFPYLNRNGERHTLTVTCDLNYTVNNAAETESIETIKRNAPANYYVQNRMITGEDYNLAPLTSSQDILKVRAVNRTSSGISRNFDILDASGKYSDVTVFADDGYVYKKPGERVKNLKYTNRSEVINFLRNSLEPVFRDTDVFNFYFTRYPKILFSDTNIEWNAVTNADGSSTGYFINNIDNSLLQTGTFATNNLRYLLPGAIIRFDAPEGFHFMTENRPDHPTYPEGTLMPGPANHPGSATFIWAKVVSIQGDGTNAGRGELDSGLGPVRLSELIPSGAIASRILPKFVSDLPNTFENALTDLIFENTDFGIRYDNEAAEWKIIQNSNLNLQSAFSLGKSGDTTNSNLDSSWVIAFVRKEDRYDVRIRTLDYIFGSLRQNRFYFDRNDLQFNDKTVSVTRDLVKVLGINTDPNQTQLINDIDFEIDDTIKFDDGYESQKEIKISFSDSDRDGVIDNPDSFEQIVGTDLDLNYLFFTKTVDEYGYTVLEPIDRSETSILLVERESLIDITNYADGQLIYFYDPNENRVKKVDRTTNLLVLQNQYEAYIGRSELKFQYVHNASIDRRIDPSVSNIVDIYLLPRSYDIDFRNWLQGTAEKPETPTSDRLRITYGNQLNSIKSISDEIVYNPVKYKVLFGAKAEESLQARFLVVKNQDLSVSDNDLKVKIINAINDFFNIDNWDFGDRFYLSEMNTYIFNVASPDISNFTVLPRQNNQAFGNLFEIQSAQDEIFVSGATVNDIEIVSSINSQSISSNIGNINSSTNTGSSTSNGGSNY